MLHAQMWDHVSKIAPDDIAEKIARVDHILPILGALSSNPKTTAKDVIKAAAGVAANGTVAPSEAVQFITSMPAEQEKLQPWLRRLYEANLSAAVHLKAAAMQQTQQAAPPQQPVPMQAPGVMPSG